MEVLNNKCSRGRGDSAICDNGQDLPAMPQTSDEQLIQCDAALSFRDESFPPETALADYEHPSRSSGHRTVWVPASMLLTADPRQRVPLFFEITADVKQGALGDCWLIASIACIANFPEEVEALFGNVGASAAAVWAGRLAAV